MLPVLDYFHVLLTLNQERNKTMKHKCIMCGEEVKTISGKLPQKVTWYSLCDRCNSLSDAEQIKYPTEQKIDTAKRVTYAAEVVKYYDRREAVRIMVRDLTDEKLFKLLRDIIGGEE